MKLSGKSLIIRADANSRMGIGHVMRCRALAFPWQSAGGHVRFVCSEITTPLRQQLTATGISVERIPAIAGTSEDAQLTAEIARRERADWIVLDGYQFSCEYDVGLGSLRRMVVSDFGESRQADLILNQNLHARATDYVSCGGHCRLLLGNAYVLLRPDFLRFAKWERPSVERATRVLVTMGGGDHANMTSRVVRALRAIDPLLEATVVVGHSNPHLEEIHQAAVDCPHHVNILQAVEDMPTQMATADIAISAAGSTCWELAYMGLPSLVMATAENQVPIARSLEQADVAVNLGWHTEVGETTVAERLNALLGHRALRQQMSQAGRQLVDGRGAARVLEQIIRHEEQVRAYSVSGK